LILIIIFGYLIVLGYLIGSIPFALLIGKIFHGVDIRKSGSGNLGATNAFRVLGKKSGTAVLIGDFLKGTLAASLPFLLTAPVSPMVVGLAAVIGHVFPVFAKFKGGKAVATSAGILLYLSPPVFLVSLVGFIVSLFLFRMVSLASMLSIVGAWIGAVLFEDMALILLVSSLNVFIFIRHRANIVRIMKGEEPKVNFNNKEFDH
jgi:acyl phosphate:glycerol-3-phosphate acyltransferase